VDEPINEAASKTTAALTAKVAAMTSSVAQAAVSVVLLCDAGLLIPSLQKLEHQHFGLDPAHRIIARFNAQTAGLQPEPTAPTCRKWCSAARSCRWASD
jgi:hypothetical protein